LREIDFLLMEECFHCPKFLLPTAAALTSLVETTPQPFDASKIMQIHW